MATRTVFHQILAPFTIAYTAPGSKAFIAYVGSKAKTSRKIGWSSDRIKDESGTCRWSLYAKHLALPHQGASHEVDHLISSEICGGLMSS
ncbi:MAG: hypothetical protein JOZ60_07380 [Verrucomicrobia bacterium]|nr:hypothetical protein [Verrucomicrobiota bacterium]